MDNSKDVPVRAARGKPRHLKYEGTSPQGEAQVCGSSLCLGFMCVGSRRYATRMQARTIQLTYQQQATKQHPSPLAANSHLSATANPWVPSKALHEKVSNEIITIFLTHLTSTYDRPVLALQLFR